MKNQDEFLAAVVFKAVAGCGCHGCIFINTGCDTPERLNNFPCRKRDRKDGKSVIWTIKSV